MAKNITDDWKTLVSNSSFPETNFPAPVTFDGQMMLLFLGIFIFFENFIVLLVLLCSTEVKKKHRVEFILWLCLSDIIISVSCIMYVLPISIETISNIVAFCSTLMDLVYAGIAQSLAHTCLVCIERYLALININAYQTFTKQYKYILIFGTCVFVQVYTGIMAGLFLRTESISTCRLASYPDHSSFQMAVSVVCLPLLILIIGIYTLFVISFRRKMQIVHPRLHIMVVLESVNVQTSAIEPAQNIQRRQKREKETIITVGCIVGSLLLLSGPYVFVYFLQGFSLVEIEANITGIVTGLIMFNSFLNPILYAIRIPTFRKELRRVLRIINC